VSCDRWGGRGKGLNRRPLPSALPAPLSSAASSLLCNVFIAARLFQLCADYAYSCFAECPAGFAHTLGRNPQHETLLADTSAASHTLCTCCTTSLTTSTVILREVWKSYGLNAVNDDEADAIVLTDIGCCLVGKKQPRNQAQREVLTKLCDEKKPKKRRKNHKAAA